MSNLDNNKVIIIIIVTSVIGVIVAATIIVLYFLLRGKSEKEIHRDSERLKRDTTTGVKQAPQAIGSQPTYTLSNEGTLAFAPHDAESLSTLTQTVTLGPQDKATHIVSLDQWVGNASKPTPGKASSSSNEKYHPKNKYRHSSYTTSTHTNGKRQPSEPREVDDDLRISIKNKQLVKIDSNHKDTYLSEGALSRHEEKLKRKL